VTDRLAGHADHWRVVSGFPDEQLADVIQRDQIDILVDLAGHTDNNRLMVFARKPAPVQVTWLGYPSTTGLTTMDYRLTDPWLDPPGVSERFHSETLIRLPATTWCFHPWTHDPVGAPPVLRKGYITFGSLNNLAKITSEAVGVWSKILSAVPRSRMALLVSNDGFAQPRLMEMFRQHGISADCLEFFTNVPHHQYMKLFNELDVALDTFPYNGQTTTCNALWMGVPVVALEGNTYVSRASLSILGNLNLLNWVARDADGYVQTAARLARDHQALGRLRQELRARLRASPVMDAKRFAVDLESAYKRMWSIRCRG
jgi:predicted O-linked N-acetylglucosamine transferase (SPINDLY family)